MNVKTQYNQSRNPARLIALVAALLTSSALFAGVVSLADQPLAPIVAAQVSAPAQG